MIRLARVSAVLIATALYVSLPARASAQDKAAAEALFDEGRRLAGAGQDAAACAKFEESQSLEPAAGTLLNMADCYEKLGKTASAWAALREAAARAQLAGEVRRADAARAKAQSLEPGLTKLQLAPSQETSAYGLEIRRDDVVIPSSLLGTALPVDPGRHVIRARASGYRSWSQNIEIPNGPALTVLYVPKLEPVASPSSKAVIDVHPAGPARDAGLDRGRTLGLAILAAGVGGLVSSAIAGAGAIVFKDRGQRDEARGWAEAFDWIVIPSAVATAVGAAFLLAAPGTSGTQRVVAVFPVVGSRDVSVVASHEF